MNLQSLPPFVSELVLSVVLGIVQGITEFLPISSTAHLLLTSEILTGGRDIGLTASNVIQFGTLIAILRYYWGDIKSLLSRLWVIIFKNEQRKRFISHVSLWWNNQLEGQVNQDMHDDVTLVQLVIATLPIIVFALLARRVVENLRDNLLFVALFLILGAILITAAEIRAKKSTKQHKNAILGRMEVLLIGLFQCFAVFPGMSRSGSTMAGALFLGRPRSQSVRFSFLLSIPALGLSSVYDLIKAVSDFLKGSTFLLPVSSNWTQSSVQLSVLGLFVAFVVAYFVGIASLRWLLRYIGTNDSRWFITYRIILASLIIWAVSSNLIR
jgi:undecaprenyl-diphosphatase